MHVSGKGDLYYGLVAEMVWKAYKKFQEVAAAAAAAAAATG